MHCYLNSTLSLGDNLAGSWDISRNLPISWRRNWDKLIFSVHFQTLDRETESSTISHDRLEHTDYLGPSQQGENCFLNQPVFYKPWDFGYLSIFESQSHLDKRIKTIWALFISQTLTIQVKFSKLSILIVETQDVGYLSISLSYKHI